MIDEIWLAARYLAELSAVALGVCMLIGGKVKTRSNALAVIFVISYFTYLVLGMM